MVEENEITILFVDDEEQLREKLKSGDPIFAIHRHFPADIVSSIAEFSKFSFRMLLWKNSNTYMSISFAILPKPKN